ncbi:MAG: decaprenyl-phosphate phosphoribosyltransferase [Planctomycetes bacterium]|nr:decaprenyl-phosphate phosphoribosyltransferase [Planctomycetota bacterium]
MPPLLRSLRPRQWTKNLVVFAGLVFSGQVLGAGTLDGYSPALAAFWAFLAFCAASSAVYLVNDVLDRERDRLHPVKRLRPIASGQVAPRPALGLAALLAAAAVAASLLLARPAAGPVAAYLALQLAYSLRLKHVVLLDVFCIAAGFLLRVLAGVWAIDVPLSPWLVACSVQLALFLALCKRKAELVALDQEAPDQRPLLAEYDGPGLDVMVAIVASATVVTYGLYTLLPGALLSLDVEIESQAGRPGMVWTFPFVLYGVLRYLHLVYQKERGQRPERLLIEDRPLLLAILGYAAVVAVVLYR